MIGIAFSDESEASTLNKKVLNRKKYAGKCRTIAFVYLPSDLMTLALDQPKIRSTNAALASDCLLYQVLTCHPQVRRKIRKKRRRRKVSSAKLSYPHPHPSSISHTWALIPRKVLPQRTLTPPGSAYSHSSKAWEYLNRRSKRIKISSRTSCAMQRLEILHRHHHLLLHRRLLEAKGNKHLQHQRAGLLEMRQKRTIPRRLHTCLLLRHLWDHLHLPDLTYHLHLHLVRDAINTMRATANMCAFTATNGAPSKPSGAPPAPPRKSSDGRHALLDGSLRLFTAPPTGRVPGAPSAPPPPPPPPPAAGGRAAPPAPPAPPSARKRQFCLFRQRWLTSSLIQHRVRRGLHHHHHHHLVSNSPIRAAVFRLAH